MKFLATFSKQVTLGVALVFLSAGIVTGILYQSELPQRYLKDKILEEIQASLDLPIDIRELSGPLVGELTFEGVQIGDSESTSVQIPKISIHYNPLKLMQSGGNVQQSISRIELESPIFHVIRNKKGMISLGTTLANPKNTSPQAAFNLPFQGLISLSNAQIHFSDARGWGITAPDQAFESRFFDVNGTLIVSDQGLVLVDLATQKQYPGDNHVSITGQLKADTQHLDLDFAFKQLNLDHWSRYVLPVPGYRISDDKVDIAGKLTSNTGKNRKWHPYLIDATATLSGTNLQLPFFPKPATKVRGLVHLKNNDTDNPKWRVIFEKILGTVAGSPAYLDGSLYLDEDRIRLRLASTAFDYPGIKELFPDLSTWDIEGKGPATLWVKGKASAPLITVKTKAKQSRFFALSPEDIDLRLAFNSRSQDLDIDIQKATLYERPLTGNIQLNFASLDPTLRMAYTLGGASLTKVFPALAPTVTGNATFSLSASGTVSEYAGMASLSESNISAWNQSLNGLTSQFTMIDNSNLVFHNIEAEINQKAQAITASGHLQNFEDLTLLFSADQMPLSNEEDARITTRGNVFLSIATPLEEQFKTTMTGSIDYLFQDLSLYSQYFQRIEGGLTLKKGVLSIANFQAKLSPKKWLKANGELLNFSPKNLSVSAKDFHVGDKLPLYTVLPNQFLPLTGDLSGDLLIKDIHQLEGDILLTDAMIKGQRIKSAKSDFSYENGRLSVKEGELKEGRSAIFFNGQFDPGNQLSLTLAKGSFVNLNDFSTYTLPYGILYGYVYAHGAIQGSPSNPSMNLTVDGHGLETYFLTLDRVKGNIRYSDHVLSSSGLTVTHKGDDIDLEGKVKLSSLQENKAPLDYALSLETEDSNLKEFINLLATLYKEVQYRQGIYTVLEEEDTPNQNMTEQLIVSHARPMQFFDEHGQGDALSLYHQLLEQRQKRENKSSPLLSRFAKGRFSASFSIASKPGNLPKIDTSLNVNDLYLGPFYTSKLSATIQSKRDRVTYQTSAEQGHLGSMSFQSLSGRGHYDPTGTLTIANLALDRFTHKNPNFFKASIPVSAYWDASAQDNPLSASLTLIDNDITLLSTLFPTVSSLENKGKLSFKVSGTMSDPVLSATQVDLNRTKLSWTDSSLIQAPFILKRGSATVSQNRIALDNIQFEWSGSETRRVLSQSSRTNKLTLNGSMDLNKLSLLKPDLMHLDMGLRIGNTTLTLNYPGLIRGDVDLRNLSLQGPLQVPLSDSAQQAFLDRYGTAHEAGPVLAGNLNLKNADISLRTEASEAGTLPSILLNLSAGIGEDVTMSGSLFGGGISGLASGLDVEFAQTETPISITGSLAVPIIEDQVELSHGSLVVLNRQFDLLQVFQQRAFTQNNAFDTAPNTVGFQQDQDPITGKKQAIPVLNLKALTIIEPISVAAASTSENATVETQTVYTPVLLTLQGPITQLNQFQFDEFESETRVVNEESLVFKQQYSLSTGAEESLAIGDTTSAGIVRLLLPELFLDEGSGSSSTELVGNALLANQLDLAIKRNFLRPVEKRLAQNIGLYDLRVNYNVGAAIIDPDNTTNANRVGVDAVSQVFRNKMFLRVSTDLFNSPDDDNQAQQLQLSEVALTYYLLQNVSLNLSNGRDENNEFSSARLSLRVSHAF